MIIRKEHHNDYPAVFKLIETAFKNEPYTDHKEQFLVERLRNSVDFIPDLSLVAEIEGEIVGYILLTNIEIKDAKNTYSSLVLAPVAVLPAYQNKGIGAQLIKEAHNVAKTLGFQSIVLLGHENYYPRFGYQLAKNYGIELPFDVPDENCMVLELFPDALKNTSGIVQYPQEFFED